MLDIKFIRENSDLVETAAREKNVSLNTKELLDLDDSIKSIQTKLQALQADKNSNAKKVPKASNDEKPELIKKGKEIGAEIEALKPSLLDLESQLKEKMLRVPGIPSKEAPRGKDESENIEIKTWGKKPEANFKLKDHVELLEENDWADFEKIAAVSGSRTYSLKNDMVLLEMALHRFALDRLKDKGFTLVTTPALVREHALIGTGHFPDGKDQVYHLPEDDLYLTGTSEVVLNALHAGEKLKSDSLPILYAGYSPCFRREAGSYGRDVRGLIRVHQFMKVEQYIICKNDPEESKKWHQFLLETSEEIVQKLNIPYRIVECCTGDMGLGKYRMFDIECWVPSENKYRETHSCSSLHDWQARRTNLRYKDENKKMQFCHTLNNTAIATPRFMVAFLENHQQSDGSIKVPESLRPYLMGTESLKGK